MKKLTKQPRRSNVTAARTSPPLERHRRSNVTTTVYDPDKRNLDITFHNGRTYRYHDVPEKHGNGIIAAESQGSYLHQHITKHYDFSELPKD